MKNFTMEGLKFEKKKTEDNVSSNIKRSDKIIERLEDKRPTLYTKMKSREHISAAVGPAYGKIIR